VPCACPVPGGRSSSSPGTLPAVQQSPNPQAPTIGRIQAVAAVFSSRSFNIIAVTLGEVHIVALLPLSGTMSFQRSSALESQPTTWRREDDASYADDPEFRDFAEKLSDDLFALTRNVARLSQETAKLGTKHETARVRERVKTTVEETSEKFKELGEGLKKVTTWPDVGVRRPPSPLIIRNNY